MYSKLSTAVVAATLCVFSFFLSSEAAITPGTIALENWFSGVLPTLFPNSTANWRHFFHDGTFSPNAQFSVNDWVTVNGVSNVESYWANVTSLVVQRTDSYTVAPTGIATYPIDKEGKSGWIVVTGRSSLRTKAGKVYTDGAIAASIEVKWNKKLGKRTVVSWRDVGTPPNYPNYPWN